MALAIPRFNINQNLVVFKDNDKHTVSLIDLREDCPKFENSVSLKEAISNVHAMERRIVVATQSSVFVYEIDLSKKSFQLAIVPGPFLTEMSVFQTKPLKYGLVVASQKSNKMENKVLIYSIIDAEKLIYTLILLEDGNEPTGLVTAIFFSQNNDKLYLYQQDICTIWCYQWSDAPRLKLLEKISLRTGLTDQSNLAQIQRIYYVWDKLFLLYFKNGSLRLIDCSIVVTNFLVWKKFLQFELLAPNVFEDPSQEDSVRSPVVFLKTETGSMSKPQKFKFVSLKDCFSR